MELILTPSMLLLNVLACSLQGPTTPTPVPSGLISVRFGQVHVEFFDLSMEDSSLEMLDSVLLFIH